MLHRFLLYLKCNILKMKKFVAILLIYVFPVFCCAQTVGENLTYGVDLLLTKQRHENRNIDGSPYIEKNFLKARVSGYNNEFELRYNAYEDEMEFLRDDNIFYINRIDNQEFFFPSIKKKYVFLNYTIDRVQYSGYLVLLSDPGSNIALLKKESIGISDGVTALNSYQESKNPSYNRKKDAYYISIPQGFFMFPKNARDAALLLGLEQNKIEKFTKEKKLSFNKELDMIQLIEFFGSISMDNNTL